MHMMTGRRIRYFDRRKDASWQRRGQTRCRGTGCHSTDDMCRIERHCRTVIHDEYIFVGSFLWKRETERETKRERARRKRIDSHHQSKKPMCATGFSSSLSAADLLTHDGILFLVWARRTVVGSAGSECRTSTLWRQTLSRWSLYFLWKVVISLQIVFPNYLPIANIEVSESNKKDGITCRKEILVIFFRK